MEVDQSGMNWLFTTSMSWLWTKVSLKHKMSNSGLMIHSILDCHAMIQHQVNSSLPKTSPVLGQYVHNFTLHKGQMLYFNEYHKCIVNFLFVLIKLKLTVSKISTKYTMHTQLSSSQEIKINYFFIAISMEDFWHQLAEESLCGWIILA